MCAREVSAELSLGPPQSFSSVRDWVSRGNMSRNMSLAKKLFLTFCVIFLVVISLQRLLGVYAIFITALFMFLDVDYFLQAFWRILVIKFTSRSNLSVLDTSEHSFYVLPSDLDMLFHMNNVRYPRQCDFSRIQHWFESGIRAALKKFSCHLVVGAFTIRYRRSLQLFQKVRITTKVMCWDDKAFYMEQCFLSEDNFVCAVATVKQSVVQGKERELFVTPVMLVECLMGRPIESPPPPLEIQHWIDYNNASSNALRNM